jgi:hypothetical protein
MNTLNNIPKQYDTVYHVEYGKGTIVTIQYRKDGGLAMCYFPKAKVHDWITIQQLCVGTGDITMQPLPTNLEVKPSDDLQSALERLFLNPQK